VWAGIVSLIGVTASGPVFAADLSRRAIPAPKFRAGPAPAVNVRDVHQPPRFPAVSLPQPFAAPEMSGSGGPGLPSAPDGNRPAGQQKVGSSDAGSDEAGDVPLRATMGVRFSTRSPADEQENRGADSAPR